MAFTEVLNLEKIFVNYFAGSYLIFYFIAIAFFAYLAARFRLPNFATLMLLGLFVIFMANWVGIIVALVLFVVGAISVLIWAKVIKS